MTTSARPPVVEVLRRRVARPVEPLSTPLSATVLTALGSIVRDMRDVPRDCIRDPVDLVIWLRRMAERVEGVERMRVVSAPSQLPASSRAYLGAGSVNPASPRELAEAVFGKMPQLSTKPVQRRTVMGRKGRIVPVESRRTKCGGQMELKF